MKKKADPADNLLLARKGGFAANGEGDPPLMGMGNGNGLFVKASQMVLHSKIWSRHAVV